MKILNFNIRGIYFHSFKGNCKKHIFELGRAFFKYNFTNNDSMNMKFIEKVDMTI